MNLQEAKKELKKVKYERHHNHKKIEFIVKQELVELGMEDKCLVTIEVDSIGAKWITGLVRGWGKVLKFHTPQDINAYIHEG